MRDLKNKRAIITGAAAGIGRALAVQLAELGTHLLLIDRDEPGLAQVAEQVRACGIEVATRTVDLARANELQLLCESVVHETPLDLLVNNAGIVHYGPTDAMQPEDLERLLAVNLLAPLQLTRALLPSLLARPEAHVVNIASIYGWVARRYTAAYHASKFGLVGFSESLRKEYVHRLGVTTVCPGFVNTGLFAAGTSSTPEKQVTSPPAWLCTTPEVVARKTIRGIQANRGLVLVTPLAYALYYTQRFAPWLLDLRNAMQSSSAE